MRETEVKIRSTKKEHIELMKRLVRLGFKRTKSVNEINTLYEHPAIPLKTIGHVLRVRKADTTTLTYKGKRIENKQGLKIREEYEVAFSNGNDIEKILAALGFSKDMIIRKKRTVYRKGQIEVDFDVLPSLGYFIEIEGSEKNILSLLKQLGLEKRERITKGYAQLLREEKQ